MMTKINKFSDEKILIKLLPSGVKCYIIPKKGFVEKHAAVCVRCGSADVLYEKNGERQEIPPGTAHFLEHKMFEDENMNVIEEFSRLGCEVNAFTSFNSTAYHFSCANNFEKGFGLLLDFVTTPYFTDENIEAEKGIIKQEIDMYDDDPNWIVYFQMLCAMYKNHTVSRNIAGTRESVQKITKDNLCNLYNDFYKPSNIAVICVGDVDLEFVFNSVSEQFSSCSRNAGNVKRFYNSDEGKIKSSYAKREMGVAKPKFYIGYKDFVSDYPSHKKIVAMKMAVDIIAGESGELYNKMYDMNLIDKNFSFDYMCGTDYGHSIFGGTSESCEKVSEMIYSHIEKLKIHGIDRFETVKKKNIGRFARLFNYTNSISNVQVDCFVKNFDIIDLFSAYQNVTEKDIAECLNESFDKKSRVISLVV